MQKKTWGAEVGKSMLREAIFDIVIVLLVLGVLVIWKKKYRWMNKMIRRSVTQNSVLLGISIWGKGRVGGLSKYIIVKEKIQKSKKKAAYKNWEEENYWKLMEIFLKNVNEVTK